MKNSDDLKPDLLSTNGLQVDEQSGRHFKEAGTWAKAVAVIVSILGGLVTLLVLVFGSIFSKSLSLGLGLEGAGGVIIFAVVFVMAIALIGIINLFRFSSGMSAGINNQDAGAFDKGISGLKNYLILMGVLTLLTTIMTITKFFT